MKKLLYFSFIIILFYACKKEDCKPIDRFTNDLGQYLFTPDLPVYSKPYFNPNNPDEFIFIYNDINKEQVFKYSLETQKSSIIYDGNIGARVKWSKKDWILLNILDEFGFNIYKVKSNGEELSSLTTNGLCFYPEWNKEGDKFIYDLGNTSPDENVISNEFGNPLDTVFAGAEIGGSWSHDSLIINATTVGLYYSNPSRDTYKRLLYFDPNPSISGGAIWLDQENVLWSNIDGIFKTNINEVQVDTIRESCNALYYLYPTYAPQTNKVLFQKVINTITDKKAGTGVQTSRIVMMNADGTDEVELDIFVE